VALAIPKPPSLRPSSLKATTRAMLLGHGLRQRAVMPDEAFQITLTPYAPSIHGGSFWLHLWLAAVKTQEHVAIFGPAAETIEGFVQAYRTFELLVCHRSNAEEWFKGQGFIGVAFVDDVDGAARARVHHFILPDYRTPRISQGLGRLTLDYYFQQRGFSTLYGLTPAQNHAALRFARRLGFERYGVKPMMYLGQIVDGIETVLHRAHFAALQTLQEG
jgi:RimJ/RimL family protein N-acetyltransferase